MGLLNFDLKSLFWVCAEQFDFENTSEELVLNTCIYD